jgi:hypothetical protein
MQALGRVLRLSWITFYVKSNTVYRQSRSPATRQSPSEAAYEMGQQDYMGQQDMTWQQDEMGQHYEMDQHHEMYQQHETQSYQQEDQED